MPHLQIMSATYSFPTRAELAAYAAKKGIK